MFGDSSFHRLAPETGNVRLLINRSERENDGTVRQLGGNRPEPCQLDRCARCILCVRMKNDVLKRILKYFATF